MLGQLQDKAASVALSEVLKNMNEHPMVRHEAAEALGSIAGTLKFELPVRQLHLLLSLNAFFFFYLFSITSSLKLLEVSPRSLLRG